MSAIKQSVKEQNHTLSKISIHRRIPGTHTAVSRIPERPARSGYGGMFCMRGYRKIGYGYLNGKPEGCDEENSDLDDQIRSCVHSPIIGEMEKSGCSEFYVVVYKKVEP